MMGGGNVMLEDGKHGVEVLEAPLPPPLPPPPLPQFVDQVHRGGEPISAGLGIDYAFPPYLEYAYPPPDGNILTNIVNALIAVPRFYTQVLHLMNKMNLPAPFRPALPTPPLPPPAPAQAVPKRQAGDLSSGESELESSEEDETDRNELDGKLMGVEKPSRRIVQPKKRAKGEANDMRASHESAGVKTIVIPKAPTAIKKNAPVLQFKIAPKGSTSDIGAGKSKVEESSQAEPTEAHEELATASREELEAGRLQTPDMLSLPIFKKYARGNPTPVLYIKNLAKDVTPDDMYYIFGAFFPNRSTAVEQVSVKVMQEGRMRGQAFVCLPTTELAMVALAGTHGFVFKGKPMVVQFGHNDGIAKSLSSTGVHNT